MSPIQIENEIYLNVYRWCFRDIFTAVYFSSRQPTPCTLYFLREYREYGQASKCVHIRSVIAECRHLNGNDFNSKSFRATAAFLK